MVASREREPDDAADLCRPFLASLPISGACITVITSTGSQSTLCSSDPIAARIDELQFELGEGPLWAAAGSGDSVLLSDVAADAHDEWPVFGSAVRELAVGAIFSIPMHMGAATVGVATLYCDRPRWLDEGQQTTALAIASAVASSAVQRAMLSAADEVGVETPITPALRREVHQATGMILVYLNTTATVAYSRLQAYAFASGQTVQAVAHDVVTGKLRFEDAPP
jgi:hypothetical protein